MNINLNNTDNNDYVRGYKDGKKAAEIGLTDRIIHEAKNFAFYNYCTEAKNSDADFDNLKTWPFAALVAYYAISNYMSGNPVNWPFSTKTIPMDLKDASFETALRKWKGEVEEAKPIEYMPIHPEDARKFDCPEQFPMHLLDEGQAISNHSQSLKRLKERGGLSVHDILAVAGKKPYSYYGGLPWAEALKMLNDIVITNPQQSK